MSATGPLATANVYRFSSKELHASTGFYYYGFRFYDPQTQRWVNRDPLGEEGGVNLYGFVGNGPIGAVDPDGLCPAFIPAIWVLVASAGGSETATVGAGTAALAVDVAILGGGAALGVASGAKSVFFRRI